MSLDSILHNFVIDDPEEAKKFLDTLIACEENQQKRKSNPVKYRFVNDSKEIQELFLRRKMVGGRNMSIEAKVKLIHKNCDKDCKTCALEGFKDCSKAAQVIKDLKDVKLIDEQGQNII